MFNIWSSYSAIKNIWCIHCKDLYIDLASIGIQLKNDNSLMVFFLFFFTNLSFSDLCSITSGMQSSFLTGENYNI